MRTTVVITLIPAFATDEGLESAQDIKGVFTTGKRAVGAAKKVVKGPAKEFLTMASKYFQVGEMMADAVIEIGKTKQRNHGWWEVQGSVIVEIYDGEKWVEIGRADVDRVPNRADGGALGDIFLKEEEAKDAALQELPRRHQQILNENAETIRMYQNPVPIEGSIGVG